MSSSDIFKEYFRIIDSYFRSVKPYLGEHERSHIDLGEMISQYPLISDLIIDATDDLEQTISDFWQTYSAPLFNELRDSDTLKCIYSGDISPLALDSFVKKSSLYIDTTIIQDPILNLTTLQKHIAGDKKYYLNKLIRHVFNIWKLEKVILADVDKPILAVAPTTLNIISPDERERTIDEARRKYVTYMEKLFDKGFTCIDQLNEFLTQFSDLNDLYSQISCYQYLPNDIASQESFNAFFENFNETAKFTKVRCEDIGRNFGLYIVSQFIRVQEHRMYCDMLTAEPIYDIQKAWFFFNYDVGGMDMDASIASALQKENFQWISKVPLSALKVLREEDNLEYMRSALRKGITDLKAKNDTDLIATAEQVQLNLQDAFNQQQAEIERLETKVASIIKKEIPITSAGFLSGFLPGVANVVSLLFAGRDIKKLMDDHHQNSQAITELKGSYINLLMNTYEQSQ